MVLNSCLGIRDGMEVKAKAGGDISQLVSGCVSSFMLARGSYVANVNASVNDEWYQYAVDNFRTYLPRTHT